MDRQKIRELFQMLGSHKIVDRDDWVSGSCPLAPWLHESGTDKRPSFGISVGETSGFHCYSCQRKGSLLMLPTIIWGVTGKDVSDLRKFISDNENVFITEQRKEKTLPKPLPDKLLSEFEYRKEYGAINTESVDLWQLKYDPEEDRMIIPIRDRFGRLLGVRGRALGPNEVKYRTYSHLGVDGKSAGVWFGIHFPLVEGKYLVLVEGERDAILLKQIGIKNVWASMGASITKKQIDTARSVTTPIVLFFDNDKAGILTRNTMVQKLKGLMPLHYVTNYFGCKDPAELVETRNIGRALHALDRAERLIV